MSAQLPGRSSDGSVVGSANEIIASAAARSLVGRASEASGFALGVSGENNSAADIAATSDAVATASKHLDTVLREQDLVKIDTHAISAGIYLEKLEEVPRHRIPPEELRPCTLTPVDWSLVEIAAEVSESIYGKTMKEDEILKQRNNRTQKSIIRLIEWNGERMLVIGIRGTVGIRDWAQNLNSGPSSSTENGFHRGFLKSAKIMEPQIIQVIHKLCPKGSTVNRILFTSHSLSGAITQLFYLFAFTEDSLMQTKISAMVGLTAIDCITFGTPPASLQPIICQTGSRFFSIVNEGDLVALAQESYIKELIEIYALPVASVHLKVARGFKVPAPYLRFSGTCILLRESDDESEDELDGNEGGVQSWTGA